MPTFLDSIDGLFYSRKEILHFSESWKALYKPYPWPCPDTTEGQAPLNTKKIFTDNNINDSIRDSNYFVSSKFTPNNHSTPNVKLNRKETGVCKSSLNNSSVEAMSFSTTNPDISLAIDNSRVDSYSSNHNCVERIGSIVPSISQEIDRSYRPKFSSKEIYCDRNKNRRLRKTGIKGIRCIVSFALTDDPIKKRTQIQACSISVMILAIITISFVLVYFSSNKYPNVINVPVPTMSNNSTNATLETKSATVKLPEIESLTNEIFSTERTVTTTDAFSDSSISEKNFVISQIILKIQKNLKAYPKIPRISGDNISLSDNNNVKEYESKDVTGELCSKCQKDVEVCMLNEESGIPVCINAVDRHDPTGCGGLCALDTEACQLVDRIRGVRVCRVLSLLKCAESEWRCQNGLCVSNSSRCDGHVDCYDRSDEMHCDCDLSEHFRCGHSTSCFPISKLCDGHVDCWDGHDELNCTNVCPSEEFTCTSGQCIASNRFCDGLADCADLSDEPRGCDAACGASELRCRNARCVPRTARCDGRDNCGDATDEAHCS